jgi:hypothetical protein
LEKSERQKAFSRKTAKHAKENKIFKQSLIAFLGVLWGLARDAFWFS